jgi:hypothetical protein
LKTLYHLWTSLLCCDQGEKKKRPAAAGKLFRETHKRFLAALEMTDRVLAQKPALRGRTTPEVFQWKWVKSAIVETCGKRKIVCETVLTDWMYVLFLFGSLDATLRDREANRSLTTETMCQNLFETIRASSADGL